MIRYLLLLLIILSPTNNFLLTRLNAEGEETFLDNGREKIKNNNFSGAIKDFDKYLKLNPQSWRAYHNKGFSKEKLGDFRGAIEDYSKAIELNKKPWVKTYFGRAFSKAEIKDYTGAIEDYSKVIELDPNDFLAFYNRGLAKFNLEDFEGSIEDFSSTLNLNEKYEYAFFYRGAAKWKLSNYKGGILDNTKAIEINNKFQDAFFNRAFLKSEIKDFEGAISDYSKALKLNPSDYEAFYNRGLSKENLEDYRGAISDYSKALEINEKYENAYFNRAFIKAELKDYKGAIDDYSKLIKLNPKDDIAFHNRALAREKLDDYQGAISDYSKAIEINEKYFSAYFNRAFIKAEFKDYKGAINDYSKALILKPDYYLAFFNRGLAKEDLEDYQGAISDYSEVLKINNKYEDAYYQRAILKAFQKNHNEAIQDYSKVLELNPESYETYYFRGLSKKALNDFDGAISDFSKTLEINNQYQDAYFERALAKVSKKDFEGAKEDYTKYLLIDPNDEVVLYNRGLNKQRLKDFTGAIKDYSKALKIDNKYEKAYFERAFSKAQLGDHEGSIEDYSKVIQLNQKDYIALTNRGLSKEKIKDYEGAISDFSQALKINQNYESAYFSRAFSKTKIQDYIGAIEDYSKLIKLNPENHIYFAFRGRIKNDLNDYEGALSDFSKSLEINDKYNFAYSSRAFTKANLSDHKGAIDDFSKAIEINPNDFYSFASRGRSKGFLKDFEGALSDFSKSIKINANYSYAYFEKAYLNASLGNHKNAIDNYSKVIEIDPTNKLAFENRAISKGILGNIEGAISDHEIAYEISDKNEKFINGLNLFDKYWIWGKYEKMMPLITKMDSQLKVSDQNTNNNQARVLYAEALYKTITGEYSEAKVLLKKCIELSSQDIDAVSNIQNFCKNILVNIYITNRELKEAKKLIEFKTLDGQLQLAQIAFSENNLPKAEKILKRLYKLNKKNSLDNKADPYLISLVGSSLWFQGKNDEARKFHNESLIGYIENFGENNPALIQPYLNIAMVHYNDKEYEKTDYFLRKSLNLQFLYIQDQVPYLPLSKRNKFIKTLGISYPAIFSASNLHEKGKNLALFARINRHGLLEEIEKKQMTLTSLEGPQKDLMKRIKEVTNQLSATTSIEKNLISNLKSQKEKLEFELYRSLPELKSKIYNLEDISKELAEDSVLIEYQKYKPFIFDKPEDALNEENWAPARYQALILFPNNEVVSIDLGLASEIDSLISDAITSSENSLSDAQSLWNEVGIKIINPLKNNLKKKKILYISPDSELNRIPFSAIGGFDEDNLLGDIFKLRLITTGRELIALNKKNTNNTKKGLVVANPSFNLVSKNIQNIKNFIEIKYIEEQKRSLDQEKRLWNSLPGTQKEGEYIAQITNAKLLIGDEASSINIQNTQSPKILHIATHSFYMTNNSKDDIFASILFSGSETENIKKLENPLLRSGIVLAGANNPDKNIYDDGYLTALEVSKLNWNNTELVVISGCESGQGEIKAGEGVYGLKRAIAVAGARSSLLSLWEVDDRATAEFMETFYKKLKNGEGRADALAKTQKEFRRHSIQAWRHPYVWAAFQLSGDWRPINW